MHNVVDVETYILSMCSTVRSLMERMGKTLFFRSGGEPLILSEEQREFRKNGTQIMFQHCGSLRAVFLT